MKSPAPYSLLLHLSPARFASHSILTFFFSLQLLPKTSPVVFISYSSCHSLPLRFSIFQPSYCEKPLQTNFPLSLIDSLSLSLSLPFFLSFSCCAQSTAFISVCRASLFSPLSFFLFFSSISLLFFLEISYIAALLYPLRFHPIPLYPLNSIHTRTKLEHRHTHTACPDELPSIPNPDIQKFDFNRFCRFCVFVRSFFLLSQFLFLMKR